MRWTSFLSQGPALCVREGPALCVCEDICV